MHLFCVMSRIENKVLCTCSSLEETCRAFSRCAPERGRHRGLCRSLIRHQKPGDWFSRQVPRTTANNKHLISSRHRSSSYSSAYIFFQPWSVEPKLSIDLCRSLPLTGLDSAPPPSPPSPRAQSLALTQFCIQRLHIAF